MHPVSISDEQWTRIVPLIPGTHGGRPRKWNPRLILEGLLHSLAQGGVAKVTNHLPPWQTIYRYKQRWLEEGVLAQVQAELNHPLLKKLLKKMDRRGAFVRSRSRLQKDDPLDFYPTPPEAIVPLLRVERFDGVIWEPACGDGAISKHLDAEGLTVLSTDLVDRGYGIGSHDFFTSSHTADHVITNPPYRLAQQFADHALVRSSSKVALLVPIAFLSSKRRAAWLRANPPARVWMFHRRISMWPAGKKPAKTSGGLVDYVWVVWEKGHTGPWSGSWLDEP